MCESIKVAIGLIGIGVVFTVIGYFGYLFFTR